MSFEQGTKKNQSSIPLQGSVFPPQGADGIAKLRCSSVHGSIGGDRTNILQPLPNTTTTQAAASLAASIPTVSASPACTAANAMVLPDLDGFQRLLQADTLNSMFQSQLEKQATLPTISSSSSTFDINSLGQLAHGSIGCYGRLFSSGTDTSLRNGSVASQSNMVCASLLQNERLMNPNLNHLNLIQNSNMNFNPLYGATNTQPTDLSSLNSLLGVGGAVDQITQQSLHPLKNNFCGPLKPGGIREIFPEKLHRLLLEVEAAGRSDVVSFFEDGHAFAIHNEDVFFNEIIPRYFKQSRLSSFKRQLNLYGFRMVRFSPSRVGYCHEFFRRDQPALCRKIGRFMRRDHEKKASIGVSEKKEEERESRGGILQKLDRNLSLEK